MNQKTVMRPHQGPNIYSSPANTVFPIGIRRWAWLCLLNRSTWVNQKKKVKQVKIDSQRETVMNRGVVSSTIKIRAGKLCNETVSSIEPATKLWASQRKYKLWWACNETASSGELYNETASSSELCSNLKNVKKPNFHFRHLFHLKDIMFFL